jgi:hypothetical protein
MGLTRTLLVAGMGAAAAYFLDPVSGAERRRRLRQLWEERFQGQGEAMEADGGTIVVPPEKAARQASK